MGCCTSKTQLDSDSDTPRRQSKNFVKQPRSTAAAPSGSRLPVKFGSNLQSQKISTAVKTKVLNLGGMDLKICPEDAVTKIPELRSLDLSKNKITALPASFPNLKFLKILHLQNNLLTNISMLTDLPELETLNVSHNKLTTLSCKFVNCTKLKHLNASNNSIASVDEDCFTGLGVCLRTLNLSGNCLSLLPKSLFDLELLQELFLAKNKLTTFGTDASVPGLKQLKKLDLNDNSIQSLPNKLFESTPMHQLELNNNPLEWERLKDLPAYQDWRDRQTSEVNKQLHGGMVVKPNR